MTFKIDKKSKLHKQLTDILERGKRANMASRVWMENNFPDNYTVARSTLNLYGGIEGVKLDKKPDGWVKTSLEGYFKPKAKSPLSKEWAELPVVPWSDMTEIFGLTFFRRIGFTQYKGTFYVEIPHRTGEPVFKPKIGMIEILESEYRKVFAAGFK